MQVAVGRQAVSGPSAVPAGRLLGAGTSDDGGHHEVGLAAAPAAQAHGLRPQPQPQPAPAPAAPVGPAEQQPGDDEEQPQRQQQEQPQPQQRPAVQRVSPPGATQGALGTGWQHVKRLLLGSLDTLAFIPWATWPDYCRVNNINALLAGLWPGVAEAVRSQLVLQLAPGLLGQAANDYGAGVLTRLRLAEFDLGKVPPRLDGIKVYEETIGEQLLLEVAASWGSSMRVTVEATLQLLGRSLVLPLALRNLQLHTRLRISAQPLLDHPPFVGALGVSLLEPPHLDFELPLCGVDAAALPLLRGALRLAVRLAARQLALYPKGLSLPLVEGGAAAGGPCGMLEVRLVRVSGLRSEDLVGQSDPYVVLRLREGRQLRTRTVANSNNPEFNETFELLVDDTQTQVLQLIVMDEDIVGGGKVMGVAQVPLRQAACTALPRTRVPLTLRLHKLMAPQQGIGGVLELPVRVAGLPLTAAATGGRWLYANLAGALGASPGASTAAGRGSGSTQDRERWSKVLDGTGWLGPSEEWLQERGLRPSAGLLGASAGRPGAVAAAPARGPAGSGAAAPAGPEAAGGSPPGTPSSPAATPTAAGAAPGQGSSAFAASSTGSSRSSTPGLPAAQGTPRSPFGAQQASSPAGSSSSGGTSGGAASRRPAPGGLARLASRSAPLFSIYQGSASATASEAGSKAASAARDQGGPRPASSRSPAHAGASSGGAPGQLQGEQQQQGATEPQQDEQGGEQQSLRDVQSAAGVGIKPGAEDQLKVFYRGTVFLELTYIPFKRPSMDATGAGASPAGTAAGIAAAGQTPIKPSDLGILTVTLVRARGLTGWKGEADPYVSLALLDSTGSLGAGSTAASRGSSSHARPGRIAPLRSSTIFNEDNPRWNEKFDFMRVRADSVLLATVWDQVTVVEAATSLRLSRERFKDHVLGRVKVAVMDVANAGRVRNRWPLQGAIMGELELVLQWIAATEVDG